MPKTNDEINRILTGLMEPEPDELAYGTRCVTAFNSKKGFWFGVVIDNKGFGPSKMRWSPLKNFTDDRNAMALVEKRLAECFPETYSDYVRKLCSNLQRNASATSHGFVKSILTAPASIRAEAAAVIIEKMKGKAE